MLEFFSPDKPPSFDIVLKKLSEFGRCLITGETEKLVYVPVDTNPQNFLPSNMACVSDDIAKDISYTYYYTDTLGNFEIQFDTAPIFESYNQSILELIRTQFASEFSNQFGSVKLEVDSIISKKSTTPSVFLSLFEYLTKKHVKGIYKITIKSESKSFDSGQYQGYILREVSRMAAKAKESRIVSPGLGLVK